ncbi:MAG TPA: TetR/AcrR family transcriptional regulator [Rhizomicrobium sp.]|jgi:AcrR family transcriptional regulator|nr:TetR/AcrR family transcriptional regulator [Rhizomicrobium sp.]
MAQEKKPSRGRPRDPATRRRILAAASKLLDEGGLGAVTMEAIAARAGVGRPTVYREWPNAHAVAMSAFLERDRTAPPSRKSRRALAALRSRLRELAETLTTRAGRSTAMMIAAAQSDSELAKVFRTHFVMKSREEGRALLARATAEGDIRRNIDIEAALDLIYAPFYFRLLIGHAPLTSRDTDAILDLALKGLAARRPRLAHPAE